MKRILCILAAILMLNWALNAQDAFHQESAVSLTPGSKAQGLGLTPQMGWSTWNKFAGNINEQVIREMADVMVDKGLRDAGYIYLNIDDCWHGERDEDGFIQVDIERFPSGMKALADYVHSKGLKLGIYSDAGCKTCAGRPGSLGHEYQDALTYARWGIDYLKYDWCYSDNVNPKGAYPLMRDALAEAGRPIFFSMCEWGHSHPWEWASEVGHSWRSTGDIGVSFRDNIEHDTWTQLSVLTIVDLNEPLRQYAGPGHWNDPDMLECGNGLTQAQDRAHFTLWAMMAAPLILGNDLTNMTEDVYQIITNADIIAIDQDPLGIQGLRQSSKDGVEFWFKPLIDGKWAFTIFNRNDYDKNYSLDWQDFNFTDDLSGRSTAFDVNIYAVKDVWGNGPTDLKTTQDATTINLHKDDVVTFLLTPLSGQASFELSPDDGNWIFSSASPIVVDFNAINPGNKDTKAKYNLLLTTDKHKELKKLSKTVALKAQQSKAESFNLGTLAPGFYTLTLSKEGGLHRTFNIGVDPDKVVSTTDRQPDFEEFWTKAKQDLEAIAPEYEMILMPEKCTQDGLVYEIRMNSIGDHRMLVYMAVPKKPGKYPTIINYNGYMSPTWIPVPNTEFCVLNVCTRGQGESDDSYGNCLDYNIDNPEKYYYRLAYMDCIRAIDFAAQSEWVDPDFIFAQGSSQGGAFTLAAAAFDERLRGIAPDVPFLGDFPDYFQIVEWPANIYTQAQKNKGLSDEELYRNLSYFDIKNLTPWIECPVQMAFGLQDGVCPPHTNFASYNNIPHKNKTWQVYPLRGHDIWNEPGIESEHLAFFRKIMQTESIDENK